MRPRLRLRRHRRHRVAVWGTFDVDNYGDHLFPRIATRELAARLPGVVVDAYSPFGSSHRTRLHDARWPVAALGEPTEGRRDELARSYDAVLVGGGELLHLDDRLLSNFYAVDPARLDEVRPSQWFLEGLGPAREERCPVLWHGLGVPFPYDDVAAERVAAALRRRRWASVRDPSSAARLEAVGLPAGLQLDVVPDSGLLVDRLVRRGELLARQRRLRADGVLPPGPALVLQGCDLLVPSAGAIADVLRPWLRSTGLTPVLLETGRCRKDGDFADAVAAALGATAICRVPADAPLEDIVAVLAAAEAVVGSSLHAAITAIAHHRPFVVLNLGGEAKLDGFARVTGFAGHVIDRIERLSPALAAVFDQRPTEEHVARLQRAVDGHFDRLAELIAASTALR